MEIKDFNKLWDLLIANYGGTHNDQKGLFFHYLEEYSTQEVSIAIEQAIREHRYFPNVNEVISHIPKQEKFNFKNGDFYWKGKKIEEPTISDEEKEELDNLINDIVGGTND